MKKHKSLMVELSIAIVVITTAVLALFGFYRFSQHSDRLETELQNTAANTVARLAFSLSIPYFNFHEQGIRNIILSEMKNDEILGIYIYEDQSGSMLHGFERLNDRVDAVTQQRYFLNTIEFMHELSFEEFKMGHIRVVITRSYTDRRLWEMFISDLVQIVILDVILVLLMMILLRSRILRPILKLTLSSSEIAAGELDKPIEIRGNHEIGVLAEAFAHMQDAVKKQIANLELENEERRKAELALKESEEKYRVVVDNATIAICVTQDGLFKYVNPVMCQLLGYSEEELLGISLDEIVLPEDRGDVIRKSQWLKLGESSDDVIEFRVRASDGSIRQAEIKPVIITWEDRIALLSFANDITERKRTEELIIQSEKMMSVGGLAAGMAHEINNPLGAILQGSQNVIRRLSPDLKNNQKEASKLGIDLNRLQEYLESRKVLASLDGIREAGKRAAGIISNMLQFSRKSESIMAPIDLVKLVDNTIELANNDYDLKKKYDFRKIAIERQFDEDLPLVPCMETEIEQVLLNLFRNMAQALSEYKNAHKPKITIRGLLEPEAVRLEIEDNGPGMEEAVRKRIFEPFYTTKTVGMGTGLGLSVSYMIVTNNHKGTMEVLSEPGKGSNFIIRLLLKRE